MGVDLETMCQARMTHEERTPKFCGVFGVVVLEDEVSNAICPFSENRERKGVTARSLTLESSDHTVLSSRPSACTGRL